MALIRDLSAARQLQQRIRDDEYMSKPFEAASKYISRLTRHTLRHIAMLDILTKEMTEEFEMEDDDPMTTSV